MSISTFERVDHTVKSRTRNRRPYRGRNRIKGLPEFATYRDTGCELAPSCLKCPLVICKYDDPNWGKRNRKVERDRIIVSMRSSGTSVTKIAAKLNTSERTVYRVIQRDLGPVHVAAKAA